MPQDRGEVEVSAAVLSPGPTLLSQADIVANVDGHDAPVLSVSNDERPLALALLLDVSGSMAMTSFRDVSSSGDPSRAVKTSSTLKPNEIQPLLDRFGGSIRSGERFTLGSFAASIDIEHGFAADRAALTTLVRDHIRAAQPVFDHLQRKTRAMVAMRAHETDPFRDPDPLEPSPIWDAVNAAVDVLAPFGGRRAIILVTDGEASGNHSGVAATARRAAASAVTVSVIGVRPDFDLRQADGTAVTVSPSFHLRRLAETTGGVLVLHKDSDWIATQLDRLLSDLRERSLVTITAPADGRIHSLDLRAMRPNTTLRARRYIQSGSL